MATRPASTSASILGLGISNSVVPQPFAGQNDAVLDQLAQSPPRFTVVEHSMRLALPEQQGALRRTRVLA